MLHLWRNSPKISGILSNGLYSGLLGTQHINPVPLSPSFVVKENEKIVSEKSRSKNVCNVVGNYSEVERVLSLASEYEAQGPSAESLQENYAPSGLVSPGGRRTESYMKYDDHSPVLLGLNGHVSLQCGNASQVTEMYGQGLSHTREAYSWSDSYHSSVFGEPSSLAGYSSVYSWSGTGRSQLDRYQSVMSQFCHPARQFSTSARHQNQSSKVTPREDMYLHDLSPQGVQGDNCVHFKLWMENCQRYNLPNCDEQLESVKNGRKTLAQVFMEQEEIIRLVAENYKKIVNEEHEKESKQSSSAQGVQPTEYNYEFAEIDPCPQGLQGDDCANFKFWSHNCRAFGFPDCDSKLHDVQSGRRNLQDIFDEQDDAIRKIVQLYQSGQRASGSSIKGTAGNISEVGSSGSSADSTPPSQSAPPDDSSVKLSSRDKLKRAVKEYGITVNVFYISISLTSLGGFYLAVSSGLDVVGILNHLGGFGEFIQSRIPTGATTFVMAYVIHKVFAPVRIALTLGCTPLIVRHLRKIGFLKPPKPSQ